MSDPDGEVTTYWPPEPTDSPLENTVPFQLTKDVNLAQLQSELTDMAGIQVAAATVGPYPDGTVVLWLTPPSLDPAAVAQVIDDHVPVPDWGIPQVELDYQAVLDKLVADPDSDLDPGEVRSLAVGLAFRMQNPSTGQPLMPPR